MGSKSSYHKNGVFGLESVQNIQSPSYVNSMGFLSDGLSECVLNTEVFVYIRECSDRKNPL